MKAKLLKAVRIDGKRHAPTAGKVTLIDVPGDQFDRLAELGAVAKPSRDDLKLAGPDVDDEDDSSDTAPASKKTAPKKATKADPKASGNDTQTGGEPASGEL